MYRDLKYLIAYLLPLAGYLGLYFGGVWSFGSIYVAFVFLPLLEFILPTRGDTHAPEEEAARTKMRLFDLMLYLNLPLLAGAVIYLLHVVTTRELATYELVGMIVNVGLMIGTMGINVGHELGHRTERYEQRIAQALLLFGLYTHFYIEHNRGHHRHVATPLDPATSRRNQSIYTFWVRSVALSWWHAWELEAERLGKEDKPVVSHHNQMLVFQLVQVAYLSLIALFFGFTGVWVAIAAAVFGFLMLETVNYIEHYGLVRRKSNSGRYEPVLPIHSWNSDHELGRIFLYELTRHSDHHYRATRKYQVLRVFEQSPQLPSGYPACMILSLFPPAWFAVMNPRVDAFTRQLPSSTGGVRLASPG
ncbi:alkane 1-monooxygenase [Neolewinella antarctica]|uniref:Alkane 1-monooxygenase n=1 Tax=Neolewinella antarctica TaxID=442734 RepID=A0ABX0XFR3_9BACT|nr:alkane 1-monooxygenase [Neolewinella antarctica]NJC27726.1 alkane 1-monooxygenase [Neolewinella antarctica]